MVFVVITMSTQFNNSVATMNFVARQPESCQKINLSGTFSPYMIQM